MIQFDLCNNFSLSYNCIYTITPEFCVHFKWLWSIKGHTHRWVRIINLILYTVDQLVMDRLVRDSPQRSTRYCIRQVESGPLATLHSEHVALESEHHTLQSMCARGRSKMISRGLWPLCTVMSDFPERSWSDLWKVLIDVGEVTKSSNYGTELSAKLG